MSTFELPPYFHPTQIVMVDDSIDFLGNLSLQLDADLAYLLFDSAQKALGYINQSQNSFSLRDWFFCRETRPDDSGAKRDAPACLGIDTSALYREMHSSNRFSRISVVLVDYAMPQMNGLEFCQSIDDPHIKKILFTGVATESLAVDAFNDGIIDQYIKKHEHSVYERLSRTIRQFQQDYILDLFTHAAEVLPFAVPAMLADSGFVRLIDELRASHDLVEYYMADEPPGFFFANATGQLKRTVLQTPEESRRAAAAITNRSMPAEWRQRIASGECIVNPEIVAQSDEPDSWLAGIVPAAPLPGGGQQDKRWAVFDVQNNGQVARLKPSYNEFLEWLDTVGYSMM